MTTDRITAPLFPDINYGGREWFTIKEYIGDQLQRLRAENDDTSKDAVQTAAHRGRILQLKSILDWEQRYKHSSLAPE